MTADMFNSAYEKMYYLTNEDNFSEDYPAYYDNSETETDTTLKRVRAGMQIKAKYFRDLAHYANTHFLGHYKSTENQCCGCNTSCENNCNTDCQTCDTCNMECLFHCMYCQDNCDNCNTYDSACVTANTDCKGCNTACEGEQCDASESCNNCEGCDTNCDSNCNSGCDNCNSWNIECETCNSDCTTYCNNCNTCQGGDCCDQGDTGNDCGDSSEGCPFGYYYAECTQTCEGDAPPEWCEGCVFVCQTCDNYDSTCESCNTSYEN